MMLNNQIVRFEGSESMYRIIYHDSNVLYLISIDGKSHPFMMRREHYLEQLDSALVCEVNDYSETYLNEYSISNAALQKRDHYLDMVIQITKKEPLVYEKKFRNALVTQMAAENGVSVQTINSKLKQYWASGKKSGSLIPNYLNCGAKSSSKTSLGKKRGRKRWVSPGEGINIDLSIQKIFESAIKKYFHSSGKRSLKLTYEMMLREHFINNDMLNDEYPTYSQFYYWYKKFKFLKSEVSKRFGEKTFLKDFRAIPHSIKGIEEVHMPGYFEIDANLSDFYICSEYDREKVIGRANIYLVVDVFSRMIVSTYVGLESNAYIGATMAILNISEDKGNYCGQFGVKISENEWPLPKGTLPNYLISDRAELQGPRIEKITKNLGIELRLCSAYRPDLKGLCERTHRIISDLITPHIPGAIQKPVHERGDKDYRLSAALTLKEATQVVLNAIVHYNNYHILEAYEREGDMIKDNVKPIPVELFKWGMRNKSGALKKFDYDYIKKVLLPTDMARMTSKGVKFKGLYYVSKEHLIDESYVKARLKTWEVEVAFDPRITNEIFHIDNGKYIPCQLSDRSNQYMNKIFDDVDDVRYIESETIKALSKTSIEKKVELISKIENVVKEAKEKQTGVKRTQKSLKGISENRKAEKELNNSRAIVKDDDVETDFYTQLILQTKGRSSNEE